MWFVLASGGDYWMRVGEDGRGWETPFLHVISDDKSLVLTIPLNAPKPYAVSKGRIFQGKPTSGRWERYLLPFKLPRAVTPRFIAEIIEWATSGGNDISRDWGGELQY